MRTTAILLALALPCADLAQAVQTTEEKTMRESKESRRAREAYRERPQVHGPRAGLTLEQIRQAEAEGDLPTGRRGDEELPIRAER